MPFNPGAGGGEGGGASYSRVVISEDGTREDFYIGDNKSVLSKNVTATGPLQDERTVELYGPQYKPIANRNRSLAMLGVDKSSGSLIAANEGSLFTVTQDLSVTNGRRHSVSEITEPGGMAVSSDGSIHLLAIQDYSGQPSLIEIDRSGSVISENNFPVSPNGQYFIQGINSDQNDCIIAGSDSSIVIADRNGNSQSSFPVSFDPSVVDVRNTNSYIAAAPRVNPNTQASLYTYTRSGSLVNVDDFSQSKEQFGTEFMSDMAFVERDEVFIVGGGGNNIGYTKKLTSDLRDYQDTTNPKKSTLYSNFNFPRFGEPGADFLPNGCLVTVTNNFPNCITTMTLKGNDRSVVREMSYYAIGLGADSQGSLFTQREDGYVQKLDLSGSIVAQTESLIPGDPDPTLAVDDNDSVHVREPFDRVTVFYNDLSPPDSFAARRGFPDNTRSYQNMAIVGTDFIMQGNENPVYYKRLTYNSSSGNMSVVDKIPGNDNFRAAMKFLASPNPGNTFGRDPNAVYAAETRTSTMRVVDASEPSSLSIPPAKGYGVQRFNNNSEVAIFPGASGNSFAARAKPSKADSITGFQLQF